MSNPKHSHVVSFLLTALLGVAAMIAVACAVVLLFPLQPATAQWLQRTQLFLGFLSGAPFLIFVSIFGYRPRVKHIVANRNGFFFSPLAAGTWLLGASLLPSFADGRVTRFEQFTGIAFALLIAWVGWRLRGPKEQPAFAEQRDELDDREMTRLKLV